MRAGSRKYMWIDLRLYLGFTHQSKLAISLLMLPFIYFKKRFCAILQPREGLYQLQHDLWALYSVCWAFILSRRRGERGKHNPSNRCRVPRNVDASVCAYSARARFLSRFFHVSHLYTEELMVIPRKRWNIAARASGDYLFFSVVAKIPSRGRFILVAADWSFIHLKPFILSRARGYRAIYHRARARGIYRFLQQSLSLSLYPPAQPRI